MKPQAHRLLLDSYPLQIQVSSRYSDLDPQNHINNVAIGVFYEEGRNRLHRDLFEAVGRPPAGTLTVVAHGAISYLREGRYPGPITTGVGIGAIGRSSFVVAEALFQDGLCISTADFTIVLKGDDGARPLPENMRAGLAKLALEGCAPDHHELKPEANYERAT